MHVRHLHRGKILKSVLFQLMIALMPISCRDDSESNDEQPPEASPTPLTSDVVPPAKKPEESSQENLKENDKKSEPLKPLPPAEEDKQASGVPAHQPKSAEGEVPKEIPNPVLAEKALLVAKAKERVSALSQFATSFRKPLQGALHEFSVGTTRVESFAALLDSPMRGQALTDAGLTQSDSIFELVMHKPLLLAFSRFSDGHKITLRTQGHHLTLVGVDFQGLLVDGKSPGQAASKVKVLTATGALPEVSLQGREGQPGQNAHCPEGFGDSCLLPQAPHFDTATLPPERTEKTSSVTRSLNSAQTDPLLEHIRKVIAVDVPLAVEGLSQIPEPTAQTHECLRWLRHGEPRFLLEGIAQVESRWTEPVSLTGVAGRAGVGLPGGAGSDAQSGGELFVVSAQPVKELPPDAFAGGRGGLAGLSGLILPGKGTPSRVVTRVAARRLETSLMQAWWEIEWSGKDFGDCQGERPGTGIAITRTIRVPAILRTGSFALPDEVLEPLFINEGASGQFVERPAAIAGRSGQAGHMEVQPFDGINSLLNAEVEPMNVPLPSGFAAALQNLLAQGLVSP